MLGQPASVRAGEVAPVGMGVVFVGDSVWVVDDDDPVDDDPVDNVDVPVEPVAVSACGDVDEELPGWSDAAAVQAPLVLPLQLVKALGLTWTSPLGFSPPNHRLRRPQWQRQEPRPR